MMACFMEFELRKEGVSEDQDEYTATHSNILWGFFPHFLPFFQNLIILCIILLFIYYFYLFFILIYLFIFKKERALG